MQAAILDDQTGRNTSFLASLSAHLLVGAALLFVPPAGQRFIEPAEPVPVAIIVPAPPQAAPAAPKSGSSPAPGSDGKDSTTPIEIKPAVPASLPPKEPSAGAKTDEGLISARTILSAGVLANPRSRKAMQQLRTFSADERIVQLCNIEAMEQVHARQPAMLPEAVSPYAFQDLTLRGGSVIADGATFYSGHRWYGLRFACNVEAGKVVAFAFRIGQPVPRAQWEEHNLAESIDTGD
jgi:hypothetical protein